MYVVVAAEAVVGVAVAAVAAVAAVVAVVGKVVGEVVVAVVGAVLVGAVLVVVVVGAAVIGDEGGEVLFNLLVASTIFCFKSMTSAAFALALASRCAALCAGQCFAWHTVLQ